MFSLAKDLKAREDISKERSRLIQKLLVGAKKKDKKDGEDKDDAKKVDPKLRDYYAGRALLESRSGTLFEVGPGSNLPGVGKIETIKRVDGKVVVTTPKGTIAAALDPPRRPYYMPQGY